MIYEKHWRDYALLDTGGGKRLERWGKYILIRPDPQVIWGNRSLKDWNNADAEYIRSQSGGGQWEFKRKLPDAWEVGYDNLGLRFKIAPMGFKHMGLFPEQAVNWNFIYNSVKKATESGREINVLNLFSYTGGASVAAAKAGAKVCHVDASKGMIQFAKDNATLSSIPPDRIRYIADDCVKFSDREIRRGRKYDAVILDPPSYGRGANGEVWKIEDSLYELLKLIKALLSDSPMFILINLYTAGLAPSCAGYMLSLITKDFGGQVISDEIGLFTESNGIPFPCGAFSRWTRNGI